MRIPGLKHILLCLLSISLTLKAASQTPSSATRAPVGFRVVGYLMYGHIKNGSADSFEVSRVNYLNILYDSLDKHHQFFNSAKLKNIVSKAHAAHVLVLASIGNKLDLSLLEEGNRTAFVDSLLRSVKDLNFDGVDLDLEGANVNANYEPFTQELSPALKSQNKLLTAAISTSESKRLSDRALSCFDFISIMSYDQIGTYDIDLWQAGLKRFKIYVPGQHSSLNLAVSDLNFWTNTRHIPRYKLNLGVPFYGYSFMKGKREKHSYRAIMLNHPLSFNADSVSLQGGSLFYNGQQTIQNKTKLASSYVGGIMIWELMEDAAGDKSLLTVIDRALNL